MEKYKGNGTDFFYLALWLVWVSPREEEDVL